MERVDSDKRSRGLKVSRKTKVDSVETVKRALGRELKVSRESRVKSVKSVERVTG